jgi:hypothetical protein
MHSRDDLSCTRGYELWLIQQAKARNPAVQTYGLSWGVPAWVGNGTYYSQVRARRAQLGSGSIDTACVPSR